MDGVITLKAGVEYLVKLNISSIKFYAPKVDITKAKERNDQSKNLIPLETLIKDSGKKNGINCSFFDYSFPWWVGPYKDDTHYDPTYKTGNGGISTIAYIENNQFKIQTGGKSVPVGAKYVVASIPLGILNGKKLRPSENKNPKKRLRQRTIVGTFNDNTFFIYVHGGRNTYSTIIDTVYDFGNVKHAIFLDSGSSTSLIINNVALIKPKYTGFPNAIVW